jgi:colicin import membrane protein
VQAVQRRDPGATASAVLALTVHAMLFIVLFFGIRWRTKQPEPVMAELWSQLPAIEAPRPAPPPPVVEPKPAPKVEPKPEPKPAPKPDIAIEQEKKRKEEAEKKKREDELRAKAEAERKEKEAGDRRRDEQAAERRRMQDQLARELSTAAPKSAAPATGVPAPAADPNALAGWTDQVSAKVRANIVLPPDLVGNPEATFDVFLLPTGEVQSVKLVRSSGNRVLDDAWERAILKSSPLPRPAKPEVFRRDLRLVFRPRD